VSAPVRIDPDLVERCVFTLARYGAHGETGVSRAAYSPAWVEAQRQVTDWCREFGLTPSTDAVGNVWGRLEGTGEGNSIVCGSHIDSQEPGGRYDGALGVIAGLVALRALNEQFGRPKRTLEVVSLCEEEDTRFDTASLWGSRAITGRIEPHDLDDVRDADGVTIGEAMASVGLDPSRFRDAVRDDIDVYLELHIEQGPTLEDLDVPVGIVHAITGMRHTYVELTGRSDHAGARPMLRRQDAMRGAADIVSGVVGNALAMGAPAVTTVGRMSVEPNLASAVPERVMLEIDARHPDPELREQLYERHTAVVKEAAERHGLGLTTKVLLDLPPCRCDADTVALLERAAREQGVTAHTMHSGAVHDAQRMAEIARIAMIFVRSADGRSHSPAEFTSVEDAVAGIRVLAGALHELAY